MISTGFNYLFSDTAISYIRNHCRIPMQIHHHHNLNRRSHCHIHHRCHNRNHLYCMLH